MHLWRFPSAELCRRLALTAPILALTACGQADGGAVERFSLDEVGLPEEMPAPDPDSSQAAWSVRGDGLAIDFAQPDGAPLLSLECEPRRVPPLLTIVRHHPGRPGQKALFPVDGNGTLSRFLLDAVLEDGEWRWQGTLPAADPQLDVFTGPRPFEATLPGGGTLKVSGSRIPGEFVNWCRQGGQTPAPAAEPVETAEPAA